MILYATARASEFFAIDHHGDVFDIRGELVPHAVFRNGLYATRDNVKAYRRYRDAVAVTPRETAARRAGRPASEPAPLWPLLRPLPQSPADGSVAPS